MPPERVRSSSPPRNICSFFELALLHRPIHDFWISRQTMEATFFLNPTAKNRMACYVIQSLLTLRIQPVLLPFHARRALTYDFRIRSGHVSSTLWFAASLCRHIRSVATRKRLREKPNSDNGFNRLAASRGLRPPRRSAPTSSDFKVITHNKSSVIHRSEYMDRHISKSCQRVMIL